MTPRGFDRQMSTISECRYRWLCLWDLSLLSGLFKQVRSLTNGCCWRTLGDPA